MNMRLLLGLVLILFSTACEANVISFDFTVHNANEAGLEEKNIATNIAEQDEAGTNEDQEDGVWGIPIDREQIYLAYTPTRDYYRDGVDKGLHEESKIIDNTYYGELTLDKYECLKISMEQAVKELQFSLLKAMEHYTQLQSE